MKNKKVALGLGALGAALLSAVTLGMIKKKNNKEKKQKDN